MALLPKGNLPYKAKTTVSRPLIYIYHWGEHMDTRISWQGLPLLPSVGDSQQVLYKTTTPVFDIFKPVFSLATTAMTKMSCWVAWPKKTILRNLTVEIRSSRSPMSVAIFFHINRWFYVLCMRSGVVSSGTFSLMPGFFFPFQRAESTCPIHRVQDCRFR